MISLLIMLCHKFFGRSGSGQMKRCVAKEVCLVSFLLHPPSHRGPVSSAYQIKVLGFCLLAPGIRHLISSYVNHISDMHYINKCLFTFRWESLCVQRSVVGDTTSHLSNTFSPEPSEAKFGERIRVHSTRGMLLCISHPKV